MSRPVHVLVVDDRRDILGIALQIGVDATLRKPFTVEGLLRTVRRVLGER